MRAPRLLALSLLAGCALAAPPDSTHVSTLDLRMDFDAEDDGDTTAVTIRLDSPIGDVLLTDGDRLRLTAGGENHLFSVVRDADGIRYVSRFGDTSGVFDVDLIRPHDRSVIGLAFVMPPSFSLHVPDTGAAGPIALTWDAADGEGYTLDVAVAGACVQTLARPLAKDTGAYTIDPAELVRAEGGGTCPLDVTVRRTSTAQGEVLPKLDSGTFTAKAIQVRTVTVQWGP